MLLTMRSDTAVVQDVARPSKGNSAQVALRLPPDWLERADKVATALSRPGFEASRADALRAAIAKGLEALEVELAVEAKPRRRGGS